MTLHVPPVRLPDAPELTFWGVRGSYAVPGPGTVTFGGNTACIAVRSSSDHLIVDAGTGIAPLGRSLDHSSDAPIHILFTHLHHDHVIGLPFFAPIYRPGREIHLWCGNLNGETAEAALARMFSPPLFPFALGNVPARLVFHAFRAGETILVGSTRVRTAPLKHPSGATGYRFDGRDGSAAIITDIEHDADGPDPVVTALCDAVDTLVYDMMLEEAEYGGCKGWGHSTASHGIRLADAARARRLVGFHHSPCHDDAMLVQRETRLQALRPRSLLAREGLSVVCAPEAATLPTR
jgi:phosphoribosyl 1,2-cyclic phosphodiesterase